MTLRFNKRLASFLEAKGVKGDAAAALLGVTRGAVIAWLAGTSLPPRNQAERLAKKLGQADLPASVHAERQRRNRAKKRTGVAS